MKSNFRLNLMIIMLVFSLVLTITVSFVDQTRLNNKTVSENSKEIQLVEDHIVTSISDVDKAYQLFDKDTEKKMHDNSLYLNELYKKNPNVDSWNYSQLKERFDGMDVYAINDKAVITNASFTKDVGLDFMDCCTDFGKLLKDRLKAGKFVADGMDLQAKTGEVKKFSYFPTEDKRYILELGFSLQNGEIFKQFDYTKVEKYLTDKYDAVNNINVIVADAKEAVVLGKSDNEGNAIKLDSEKQKIAYKARTTGKIQELQGKKDGKDVVYRYIPYKFGTKDSLYGNRVIELTYNEDALVKMLGDNKVILSIQLIVIIGIALLVSVFISKLIARPMYLAFHDGLTGIANRASFEHYLQERIKLLEKKNKKTAIMVLDLDNFKKVNDELGHDAGDFLLKDVGRKIKSVLRNDGDMAARLGGDEFTIILSDVKDSKNAEEVAKRIIEQLNQPIKVNGVDVVDKFNVTASIGIALIPEHAVDGDTAYKTADKAMYHAKQSGKNTYKLYAKELHEEDK